MTYNHTEYMRQRRENQKRECPGCGKRKGAGAFVSDKGRACKNCGVCRFKVRASTNQAAHSAVQRLSYQKRKQRPEVREAYRKQSADYYARLTPDQKARKIRRIIERRVERERTKVSPAE